MTSADLHEHSTRGRDPFSAAGDQNQNPLGKSRNRLILEEFLSNSAHYPLANIFLEILLEGPRAYLLAIDFYAIILAACVQAAVIGSAEHRGRNWQFLGNFVGPALYTVIEVGFEGTAFLNSPHHIAYWVFAFLIGGLRQYRHSRPDGFGVRLATIGENVLRAGIFLVMYAIFESISGNQALSVTDFLTEKSHIYVAIVLPLLGVLLGAAAVNTNIFQSRLTETARRLHTISAWSWGPRLVAASIEDPNILRLARRERTILFMDIRGFTAWSEEREPKIVVELLNRLFAAAEHALDDRDVVRAKHVGDELMLVLSENADDLAVARSLAQAAQQALQPSGLSVGVGLHRGPVIEGLMGGENVRAYDVIGDTVNTAARLCGAAGPSEIVFTRTLNSCAAPPETIQDRSLELKGKSSPVEVSVIRMGQAPSDR